MYSIHLQPNCTIVGTWTPEPVGQEQVDCITSMLALWFSLLSTLQSWDNDGTALHSPTHWLHPIIFSWWITKALKNTYVWIYVCFCMCVCRKQREVKRKWVSPIQQVIVQFLYVFQAGQWILILTELSIAYLAKQKRVYPRLRWSWFKFWLYLLTQWP